MKRYLFDYQHKGATYGFEIYAESEEDAIDRLFSIRGGAVFKGLLGARIPGWMPYWAVHLYVIYLNWRDRK